MNFNIHNSEILPNYLHFEPESMEGYKTFKKMTKRTVVICASE